MKTIVRYRCEICGRDSSDMQEIIECEARGLPDPQTQHTIGMILACHRTDSLYSEMTFAVAGYSEPDPSCWSDKHRHRPYLWACRSNAYGDSLDDDTCDGDIAVDPGDHYANVDASHPTFIRMVAYLQRKGIPVTVWDGESPVPFDEWRKWAGPMYRGSKR